MSKSFEPFHEGELAVQRMAGEQDAARQNGVMIGSAVTPGARPFLRQQRMLVAASRDTLGRPWASIVFGRVGFVSAHDDGRSVTIDRTMALASDTDILWSNLKIGAPLGLLAIELSTRRRLRINGHVESSTEDRVVFGVDQAYPNCPKYIQRRRLGSLMPPLSNGLPVPTEGQVPDTALLAAVRKSDTAFVASGHPSRGLDASHRGGQPGFIQILAPDKLRIPDYAGNSMFNTLGNFRIDSRCGLTLLDFREGRIYQMTGEATVHLDAQREIDEPSNTGRSWQLLVRYWRSIELPIRADWEFIDYSPYNPAS